MQSLTRRIIAMLFAATAAACVQAPEAKVAAAEAPAAVAPAPPVEAPAPAPPKPSVAERLTAAAKANSYALTYDGRTFSGPGWDKLVAEGKAAQFFMLGEEHGIAENPKLAGQLFETLAKDGYAKFVIEVSPPMADALDEAARGGIDGLRGQLLAPGGGAAFFTMQEEAEMLARVRASVTGEAPVLWGVDYEVGGDRLLMARLEPMAKPKAAAEALAKLRAASEAGWARHAAEKNPQFIFTFAGDPALVRAVREAWPKRPAAASRILTTLEETLEINALWVAGKGYDSNVRRSDDMRANLLRHWQEERAGGRKPKVFFKMGSSHLVHGRNDSETFDIGTLAPEIAYIEGGKAFQVMILQGKGSPTAVFDAADWIYRPSDPKDNYDQGLSAIFDAADPKTFTLFDLRPLRAILGYWRDGTDPALMRVVHGYDMLLVMSGSTPSSNLK